MMKSKMDLLAKLSNIGGADATEIFESYIPEHYAEIYTLYELLKKADIDYNNIDFLKPKTSGDNFVFLCTFNDQNDTVLLNNFLNENGGKVEYMRNRMYKITISEQLTCTSIKFKHI